MSPEIQHFFDPQTGTLSYLVIDPESRAAAIIDPVMGYDAASARTSTASARELLDALQESGARLEWVLETHAHADHLSAAQYLKAETGARVGAGRGIVSVQKTFAEVYGLEAFDADGSDFDHLFDERCIKERALRIFERNLSFGDGFRQHALGPHELSTIEIESALVSHPAVAEAAAVGRPDDDLAVRVIVVQSHQRSASVR